jgi:CBS domain containing-hemolysin-like protein
LGAIHSRKLSSLVGYILQLMTFLLKPVLAFTGKMTRFFGGSGGEIVSRGEVEAMIDMAGNEGTLASHEKALYRNILRLDEIRVGDVMTPRTVMVDLWENSTMQDLIAENKRGKLPSRIPIYGSTRDGITGYILLREVLTAALDKTQHKIPLTEFRREVRFVPEVATLRQALHDLTSGKDPIAMVADEHGGTCGLISTEDLFETILGIEVVDELDQVTDLRDIAKTLREKRIDRLKGERSFRAQGNDNGEK